MGLTNYTSATGVLGVMLPDWVNALLGLILAIVLIKTILPIYLAQSRMVYAWAQDGLIPKRFTEVHKRFKSPVLALTFGAVLASIGVVENVQLGASFGANARVMSTMILFIFLGLGMLTFPRRSPELYTANTSWLGRHRWLQICLAILLIVVSVFFVYFIMISSLQNPFFLQPLVQLSIVGLIAGLLYKHYRNRNHEDSVEVKVTSDIPS